MRRMGKQLREVWLKIRVKKVVMYEGVSVKMLLDSSVIDMFMDMAFAQKNRFIMERLNNPLMVRNINGTINIRECHKLHLDLSLSILHRFLQYKKQSKSLENNFLVIPVTI